MADAKVNIVGNSEDAQRAVDKLRASFEKLEDKLKNQAKFSKQAKTAGDDYLKSQIQSAQSLVLGIVSVQTAWSAATGAAQTYFDTNKKIQAGRSAAAVSARETEIKIMNQGGLNKDETKSTMENINTQLKAIPVTDVTGARRMTEEMFSQNFDRQHTINADSLKSMLRLKAASNQFGAGAMDDKTLITSVAAIIRNSEGRDSTKPIMPEEIDQVAKDFHALFLKGTIQLPDLEFLARIKSVLAARGVDDNTQLAAFSVAKDAFSSGDTAATFLAQSANFMSKGGSQDMARKLKKSGIDIDASRYDLIGEDFPAALQNLRDDLDKMDERQQADTITTLYGTKSATGVLTFLSKIPAILAERDKIDNADKSGALDEAVKNFQSSKTAGGARIALKAQIASIEGSDAQGNFTEQDVEDLLRTTYEGIKADKNASLLGFTLNKWIVDLKASTINSGQTPGEYLQDLSNWSGVGDAANKRSQSILQRQLEDAYKVPEEEAAGPVPAIQMPDNMQVNDPNLQASVNTLNETMKDIRGILDSGPDRSRVIKMPAQSQGTA